MPLVAPRRFDVVCANLTADLLFRHAAKLRNLVKPGGTLVVAGTLRREFKKIQKILQQCGLTFVQSVGNGNWQSGRFTLRATVPSRRLES
jgi:ribosomal protein L11 methylase PrmA